MNSKTLAQIIRQIFVDEIEAVPARDSRKTTECPNVARFPEIARTLWSEEERLHVRGCDSYCQRMIAIQWRIEPPSLSLLMRYAAGLLPEAQTAMLIYLREDAEAALTVAALS